MTDRDRLIELVEDGFPEYVEIIQKTTVEAITDHLLANDVIIPVQCKYCRRCTLYDNVLYCTYFNRNVNEDDYCSHGG